MESIHCCQQTNTSVSCNYCQQCAHRIVKFLYCLTYEPSTDDYLVVLGSYKCGDDGFDPVSSSIDLEIFSLRANKWKHIECGSHLAYMVAASYDSSRAELLLNGAIHWLVHNHETNRNVIIAFNLKETTVSEIALPDDFGFWSMTPLDFDVLVLDGLITAWIVQINTVKI